MVQQLSQDRRSVTRYPMTAAPHCLVYPMRTGGIFTAQVTNISAVGVGLLLHEAFLPGEKLTLDLGELPITLRAEVVHAAARNGGTWFLGCTFSERLSDYELDRIRGERPNQRRRFR